MWRILQQAKADDYVLATGEMHEVREFVEKAFAEVGVEIGWIGKGTEEKGIDIKSGKTLVEVDAHYFRPTEVEQLIGNPAKARKVLDWKATTSFPSLVREMVQADLGIVARESEYRRVNEDRSKSLIAHVAGTDGE